MFKKGWNDEEIAYKLRMNEEEIYKIRREGNMLTEKEKEDMAKSRRNLIIGGAGLITLLAAGGTAYLFRQPITEIKDNLLNQNLILERQQTIDQLLKTYPSPTIEKVVYDHNGTLIKKSPQRYAHIMLHDPNLRNMLIETMMPELVKRGYSKEMVEKIFQYPETLKALEEIIRKGFDQSIDNYVANEPAGTPVSQFLFAKGLKSEVYIFQKAFMTEKRKIREKDVQIDLNDKLKIVFIHERFHTQHYSDGIELGKETIDNTKFRQLNPKMQMFLVETAAYIDCYELFRKQEKGTMTEVYAGGKMAGFMQTALETLAEGTTPLEKAIIKYQIERYNSFVPEMDEVFDKYGK